jgi:triosephosphate isomerase
MRKKLVAGNWKMNKTLLEANSLLINIKQLFNEGVTDKVNIMVCPPFINLYSANEILKDTGIKLGGQNIYQKNEGAFTGEISAKMLKSAGCDYVIIGHSERRQYFSENNNEINLKAKIALENDLIPIICVGETLEQRENGSYLKVVQQQIIDCLKEIDIKNLNKIIIAYEPVWAIGTGKTATPEQANEMHMFIRKIISDLYGQVISENIIIIYGGSVNDNNAKELFSMSDIDGGLIGGASLKADSFSKIVHSAIF